MTYEYYHQGPPDFRVSSDRITWATQRIIVICIVVFAVQLILDVPLGRTGVPMRGAAPGGRIAFWLQFQPDSFLHGMIWQPVTYMFLHAGLSHLFFNMLWLFFFGPQVERLLGTRQFVRFYILCGALGVLATYVVEGYHVLLRADYPVSVIGSSGAVMGVVVAAAVANPNQQLFLFPLPIPITLRTAVIIVIAFDVIGALTGGGGTSVETHLGGIVVGFSYMTLVPRWRRWVQNRGRSRNAAVARRDPLGEAVDKILDFEEEKRRRR